MSDAVRKALLQAEEYISQHSQAGSYGMRDHDHDKYERLPLLEKIRAALAEQPAPIDMILYCPNCGKQHIDAPEWTPGMVSSEGYEPPSEWTNPPHRSHKCHGCGCIWRPADVSTNGVAAIKTKGIADTWPRSARSELESGHE